MNQPQSSLQSGSSRTPHDSLPEPDAAAQAHSRRLIEHIGRVMDDEPGGVIDFARYMELALYAPGLGYYSAGAAKLGQSGDFITAPEISTLFGRCLARQCYEIMDSLGPATILEIGAGSGRLAVDLLGELERLDRLPEAYRILELSADLRERQQALLEAELPHLRDRIFWLDSLPEESLRGIVLANEVLDAMPVRCIEVNEDGLQEMVVGREGKGFGWRRRPLRGRAEQAFRTILEECPQPLPVPYRTEINPDLPDWLAAVAGILEQGVMLFIDYGYPRAEYYHLQRDAGTLICHYRHCAHDDPFLYPGLQDISASVDFTALAEAGIACGLEVAGFTSQAHFLIGCGLDTLLAEAASGDDERRYLQLAGEIKQLTLPAEMGERFKVMALTREFDAPLAGLRQADFRHRL